MKVLTRYFFQGLLVIIPIAVTIALVYWLFVSAEHIFRVPVQYVLQDWYVPGMGLAIGIAFTVLVGLLVKLYIVSALLKCLERVFSRLPLVRQIYGGVQDLLRFFTSDSNEQLQQVVAVNFNGARLIGFVTGEDLAVGESKGLVSVYLPMSYQVGGYLLYLPKDQCEKLDMTVQDAMQMVLTANISSSEINKTKN